MWIAGFQSFHPHPPLLMYGFLTQHLGTEQSNAFSHTLMVRFRLNKNKAKYFGPHQRFLFTFRHRFLKSPFSPARTRNGAFLKSSTFETVFESLCFHQRFRSISVVGALRNHRSGLKLEACRSSCNIVRDMIRIIVIPGFSSLHARG